jgi:cation transport ATPase
MGILFSSLLSSRALRKSIRVPAIGKRVYCVTAEEGVRSNGDLTLLKSVRPTVGFVRRAEEAPPDESLFSRYAFLQLLAAMLLAFVTALFRHSFGDYLYILSAILSCAVPVTALLAFSLPFFIGSGRIFSSGAAVAGWSGIHDIGCSRNLIVTDRDLFPEETVSIETVRIFADDSAERVIGFAGTMIAASGSGLAPCFAELMEKNGCRMRMVEDFQWLAGGGLQGRIEGTTVLCGSSDLMQLMNVKVPYRLVDRTTVLLAIDGVLYGIFKINYVGLPEIRTALQELIASNRHPIFAIRDFNITPDLLHEVFDVATDGYDFPPYGDRFRISEAKPSETSKISAVVCREGLGPLTHLADTGRSMYVAIRINLIVTAAAAVLGMLLVFVRLIGYGELSAWLPFVIMLLDAIIVTLTSLFMRF